MTQPINKVQQLLIDLMREASFNAFDGDHVADDLITHRDLWRGFLFDRDRLIKLRDIPDGYWNVDTLWILPMHGKEDELERLAREWDADTVEWISGGDAGGMLGSYGPHMRDNPRVILQLWWD